MVNSTTGCEYLVKAITASSAVPTGYTSVTSPCSVVNNNL